MARFPRVVIADVPHHVTQRGNARQVILASDADRMTYLALLREYSKLHALSLLGYCLMSNHVHLIAVPHIPHALAQALKQAHGRYASYWNARYSSSGHVWQGRFYSCPLGESHLWTALRYVELNPVRAGMVERAEVWRWSSAAAHCGSASPDAMLEMDSWSKRWTPPEWAGFLAVAGSDSAPCANPRIRADRWGRPILLPPWKSQLCVRWRHEERAGTRDRKSISRTRHFALSPSGWNGGGIGECPVCPRINSSELIPCPRINSKGSYLNVVVPPFEPGTTACTSRFSKSQVKLRPWASERVLPFAS